MWRRGYFRSVWKSLLSVSLIDFQRSTFVISKLLKILRIKSISCWEKLMFYLNLNQTIMSLRKKIFKIKNVQICVSYDHFWLLSHFQIYSGLYFSCHWKLVMTGITKSSLLIVTMAGRCFFFYRSPLKWGAISSKQIAFSFLNSTRNHTLP